MIMSGCTNSGSSGSSTSRSEQSETIDIAPTTTTTTTLIKKDAVLVDNNTTAKLNNDVNEDNNNKQEDLYSKLRIEQITFGQLYSAQMGLGPENSSSGWQLFAQNGPMKLYTREQIIDGLACDPLKAVHVVKGITSYEACHRFFSPDTRFDWELTLDQMNVLEKINNETIIFHQIHKRIWPAAQRDAVFWSHIRKIDNPKSSVLCPEDLNTTSHPELKLDNVWIVCNHSIDRPNVQAEGCIRLRLAVSLVCETYIPKDANRETITRDDLTCKIIYTSTINPGGWAPTSMLRAVYKREYPKFLDDFSNYVIKDTKLKPIAFE